MKTVIFIFKNILHSLRSEKLLSLLLILGMVVCDTIFLVFGHTFWVDTKSSKYEMYTNNVVTFGFDELSIDDFLGTIMTKEFVTSVSFSHTEYTETSAAVISAYYPEYDLNMAARLTGSLLSGNDNEFIINDDFSFGGTSLITIGDEGEWFNINEPKTQVVLGGDIANLYSVGDSITLYKLEVINGTMEYIPVQAEYIGKMKDPPFAVNLHFASNRPEYVNMFEPYENIIITNDQSLISADDIRYPLMSLLVFTDEAADKQAVKNELCRYGQPFDYTEIDEFYKAGMKNKLADRLPTTGIMLIGILFGVIGITYLSLNLNMRTFSVYYLYGMSHKECTLFSIVLNFAMLLVSMLISFIMYFIPAVNDYLFHRSMIGIYNVVFCLIFALCVIGISAVISYTTLRKSPIEILRRFE